MTGPNFSELLEQPNKQDSWPDFTFMRNTEKADYGTWFAAVTSIYKLILSTKDEPWLMDMKKDPNELTNFIKDRKMKKWLKAQQEN